MQLRSHIIWICLAVLGATTSLVLAENETATPTETTVSAPTTETPTEIPSADGEKTGAAEEKKSDGDKKSDEKKKEDGSGGSKGFFDNNFLFIILGVFILFIFLSGRSRRKQEAKKREMLASLKKGDKVISIGGIIGTIVEVRDNEVIVKVDENSNTRMRFLRDAIRLGGPGAKEEDGSEKK